MFTYLLSAKDHAAEQIYKRPPVGQDDSQGLCSKNLAAGGEIIFQSFKFVVFAASCHQS